MQRSRVRIPSSLLQKKGNHPPISFFLFPHPNKLVQFCGKILKGLKQKHKKQLAFGEKPNFSNQFIRKCKLKLHHNVGTCLWHVYAGTNLSALETCQRHVPTLWRYRFGRFDAVIYQENILSSWVFRRETASGFYPWGNVEGPRKRVAEGVCGWRHGNSFPMTQSAQSHRQMRSIPCCSKAVFYVFVFLIPFTIRQQCIIYPQKFSTEPKKSNF